MSLYQNDIQGNANVSRNINIGGHANVNGDAFINHNLVVKGWLDAPNIKGPLKGLYASEEALKATYPRPMPGWFALVGNTLPADVYRVEGGKWIPTGEKGGVFSLYLDQIETDVKDLTDEVKDIEELLADGILLAETISFTSTGTAASMTFTVLKQDGTTRQESKPIPIATTEKAGMITAADKQMLLDANGAIINVNRQIKALETTTSALKTALEKESANILELQKEVFPLVVTFDVSPTIIKAGQETTVSLSWEARRKERDVTAEADITLDGDPATGKDKSLAIVLSHGQHRQLQLRAEYAGMTVYCTRSVKGSLPTYFGPVAKTWTADEANISALSELTIGDRPLTRTGIATTDGKIALAYPKDFGALISVKDGNGYEVLSSYTRSEVSVNNHPYYCYLLTVPVTASGVTQIYK